MSRLGLELPSFAGAGASQVRGREALRRRGRPTDLMSPVGSMAGAPMTPMTPGSVASQRHWDSLKQSGMITDRLALSISALLDVPRKMGYGMAARYVIRVRDADNDLAVTQPIDGQGGVPGEGETVPLRPPVVLHLLTGSRFLHLSLEYDDGAVIGSCRISRLDPRSAKPNQYAWSDDSGRLVLCGVELVVQEGQAGPISFQANAATPTIGRPVSTLAAVSPFGQSVGPEMEESFQMTVSQLLDVPRRTGLSYSVRVLDDTGELGAIEGIQPQAPGSQADTLALGDRGFLALRSTAPMLTVKVEYSNGEHLGTAQIYRPEPRSAQLSSYSLANAQGGGVGGIELQIVEDQGAIDVLSGIAAGPANTVQVRILSAHGLTNKDSGMFGDLSDPFVVVRLGKQEHRTPTIDNNLNPVWTSKNEFTLKVGDTDDTLCLEVMNDNRIMKYDSLGTTSVALWSLPPSEWIRRRDPLAGGKAGQLEFEVRFNRGQPAAALPLPAAPREPAGAQVQPARQPMGGGFEKPNLFANLFGGGQQHGQIDSRYVQAFQTLFGQPWVGQVKEGLMPPDAPILDRLAESNFYPDLYNYRPTRYEGTEPWMKPPCMPLADALLGADRDMELLAATAEPWRAPVISLKDLDKHLTGPEFPDMDLSVLVEKKDKVRKPSGLGAPQASLPPRLSRGPGLPEMPVDEWVEYKPPPPRAQPKAQPVRSARDQPALAEIRDEPREAPAVCHRRYKLKVDRELIRPEHAELARQLCREPLCVEPDAELQPSCFEAQVVGCSDVFEDDAGYMKLWFRTPEGTEMMDCADGDTRWLEQFQTEQLRVGLSSRRGQRGRRDPLPCQDCFSMTRISSEASIFVVCDGHGPFGHIAAFRVAQSLPRAAVDGLLAAGCLERPRAPGTAEKALIQAFESASADLQRFGEEAGADFSASGTTCTVVLRVGAEVHAAWLGDARAMVATVDSGHRKVDLLMRGHTTADAKEAQRIESRGGALREVPPGSGVRRIFAGDQRIPGLFATRALGNTLLSGLGLAWQPDIRKTSFAKTPGLIVLGSGGLWDALDDGHGDALLALAVDEGELLQRGPQASASRLTAVAQERWREASQGLCDDATALLLHWLRPVPASAIPAVPPRRSGSPSGRMGQLTGIPEGAPLPALAEPPLPAGPGVMRTPEEYLSWRAGLGPEALRPAEPRTCRVGRRTAAQLATAPPDPTPEATRQPSAPSAPARRCLKPTVLDQDRDARAWVEALRLCQKPALGQRPEASLRPERCELQVLSMLDAGLGEEGLVWMSTALDEEPQQTDFLTALQRLEELHRVDGVGVSVQCLAGRARLSRPTPNQDNFSITYTTDGVVMYVVCDGFGPLGQLASFRAAQSLPYFLLEQLESVGPDGSREHALTAAFKSANLELADFAASHGLDMSCSGATATCAFRLGDEVVVGWLGDARALVVTVAGDFVGVDLMAEPHVPGSAVERQRLEKMGAVVKKVVSSAGASAERITVPGADDAPGLSVSRALGIGGAATAGVLGLPSLAKTTFASAPGLVLIGSGGLFEAFDGSSDITDVLLLAGQLQRLGPRPALSRLCAQAQDLWGHLPGASGSDDITGILLYWPPPEEAPPEGAVVDASTVAADSMPGSPERGGQALDASAISGATESNVAWELEARDTGLQTAPQPQRFLQAAPAGCVVVAAPTRLAPAPPAAAPIQVMEAAAAPPKKRFLQALPRLVPSPRMPSPPEHSSLAQPFSFRAAAPAAAEPVATEPITPVAALAGWPAAASAAAAAATAAAAPAPWTPGAPAVAWSPAAATAVGFPSLAAAAAAAGSHPAAVVWSPPAAAAAGCAAQAAWSPGAAAAAGSPGPQLLWSPAAAAPALGSVAPALMRPPAAGALPRGTPILGAPHAVQAAALGGFAHVPFLVGTGAGLPPIPPIHGALGALHAWS